MSLGNKIVLLRKQRKMSQGQLAELLSIHQSMVTRWEKDKVAPRRETLEKLAQVFDIELSELTALEALSSNEVRNLGDDPKLLELLNQLHRLNPKDLEALKSVMEAMLTRSRVQEAIGA